MPMWLKIVLDKAGIDTNIFHAHITICIQALSVKRNYGLFPVLRTWVCPMKTVRLTGQTCTFDISIFKTTLHWAGFVIKNHKKRRDVIHFERFLDFPSSIKQKI